MPGHGFTHLDNAMFKIYFEDHDQSAKGGSMKRNTLERAEFTARLMRECGYRLIKIENLDQSKNRRSNEIRSENNEGISMENGAMD